METPKLLPEAGWMERRTLPAFRYRKRSRLVMDTAEEAYVRCDVACGSPACRSCAPTSPALPAAPRHLLLPDAATLVGCLELFELPEVEGAVLLSSVLRELHEGGNMRRTARLRALYSDKRRRNFLFDNLHCAATAPRARAERRGGMALLAAAEWYYEHVGRRLPVVVLSDALAEQFGAAAGTGSAGGGGGGAAATRAQAAQQARQAQHAEPAGEAEDAELEALLSQMQIGGGSTKASSGTAGAGAAAGPAAAAAAGGAGGGRDQGIACLLDSLGLGHAPAMAAAAPPPPPQPPAQQQLQPARQPPVQPLALEPGVHILSALDYWGGCWGHLPAAADVLDSLVQSRAAEGQQQQQQQSREGGGVGGDAFWPHLSSAALEAGLASGALLAGTLAVSRRLRDDATVTVGGQQLLVSGRSGVNRAVHGDRVAVRLLPRDRWRPAGEAAAAAGGGGGGGDEGASAAGQGQEEEGEGEEDEHELMAAAGDGEADVAADAAGNADDGAEAPLGSAAGALRSAAAAGALQPTAEVVGILQRWAGEAVACIAEEDERALEARGESSRQESVLCVPTDRRLPRIRLRSRQLHRLLGQRLVLRLDGWELGSRYPHGHLVRSLGPINSLKSETDGVLVSSGVHWQPFSEGALRELPPVASAAQYMAAVPCAELAARRDLRGPQYLICSIDPPGCTDVDDALSVRWLEPGDSSGSGASGRQLVEVGVHIADVSFFVRQGGMLDSEAASRCTTVYLVDRRLDMLPALLSEDLCSLRGGQDRFAVSVLWTLDADSFEVVDTWYGRTMIRSRCQLEYSQAQDLMEGRPPRCPEHDSVAPADRPALQRSLRLLAALAEHHRGVRLQAGAVELESAELRFATDAAGQPTTVQVKQEIAMMKIVAEMMILANAAVGARIAAAFPGAALLRRHPPPRRQAFEEVSALCDSLGHPLDFDSPPTLAASLAAAAAAAPPAVGSLILSLATRAMSEAEYFCTGEAGRGGGFSHFGLALPFYTHFTSPIRRYADVVVHRQLLAAVAADAAAFPGGGPADGASAVGASAGLLPAVPPPLPGGEVAARAQVMNERHRTAKRAQKECADLYLLLLLHSKPHVESATVYGLRRGALLLFVPKYHLKAVVHLTDKHGVCRPPLRGPGDEASDDPYVAAYRRSLTVVAAGAAGGGGSGSGGGAPAEEQQLSEVSVVEAGCGATVAAFYPLQRVWVQLSADGSRAHGPRLRLRLLADSHPDAAQAARMEAAGTPAQPSEPTGSKAAAAAAGCGVLPRGQSATAARPAYRPPGMGKPAVPPPGFETAAAAAAAAGAGTAAGAGGAAAPAGAAQQLRDPAAAPPAGGDGRGGAPAGLQAPASLAAALTCFLEVAGGAAEQRQALAWQAALPPLDHSMPGLPSASGTIADGAADASAALPSGEALARTLRRLQARAARLQLRAGACAPGGQRSERRGAAAAAATQQAMALQQQLVPG